MLFPNPLHFISPMIRSPFFEGDNSGGGTGGGGSDNSGDDKQPKTWEEALSGMDDATKALYEADVDGLKSALKSERDKNKLTADQLKRLQELETAEKKRADEKLTETEKVQQQLADAANKVAEKQAEVDALTARMVADRIRTAVIMAAMQLSFTDPEDAYRLIDLADIKPDDDGKITGVKEALEKLVKAKPYLVTKSPNGKPPGTPPKTPDKKQDQKEEKPTPVVRF